MRSIEAYGSWFLSNNPDHKVSGKLTFSQSEYPKLNLTDFWEQNSIKDFFEKREYPLIFGLAIIDGQTKNFSVFNSRVTRTGSSVTLTASFFIVGDVYFDLKDISRIDSCHIRFQYLEEWIRENGFIYEEIKQKSESSYKEGIIRYVCPKPSKVAAFEGFEIHLGDIPVNIENLNFWGDFIVGECKLDLVSQKEIIIRSSERHLDDFFDEIDSMQQFLIFCMNRGTYPKKLEFDYVHEYEVFRAKNWDAFSPEKKFTIEPEKKSEHKKAEVFYRSQPNWSHETKYDRSQELVPFGEIKGNFHDFYQSWRTKYPKLQTVMNLYFADIYIPLQYINTAFLNLAQAIEGFHRIGYKEGYIQDRSIKKDISKSLEDTFTKKIEEHNLTQHKNSLIGKLNHWNDLSLRERLLDLYTDQVANCLPDSFFDEYSSAELEDKHKDFFKSICKTRNTLTHLSKESSKISEGDLLVLIRKVRLFLQVCLLIYFDLDKDATRRIATLKLRNT
jgi:hypothetical protein